MGLAVGERGGVMEQQLRSIGFILILHSLAPNIIHLYDYDKETEFFIESTDTASMVSALAYRCTEKEAKKYPQFRWVSLEEL